MTRSYLKFQDLVSNLGGFSSSYLMITGILISNYKKFLLIFEVFGHLFVLPGVIVTKRNKIKKSKAKTIQCKGNQKSKVKNEKKINNENKEIIGKNEENKTHSTVKNMTRAIETINSPINSAAPNMFTTQSDRSLPPNIDEGKIEIGNIKPLDISIHFPDNPPRKIPSLPKLSPNISLSARNNSAISPKNFLSPKIHSSLLESHNKVESKRPSVTTPIRKCSLDNAKESPSLKKRSYMFTDITEPKNGVGVRYWEYIKFRFKKFLRIQLSLKESYMLEAQRKFNQEMDVLKILEKLKEVEKLKTIIFDPVQSSAFDIFARRKINLQLRREIKDDNDAKSVLMKFSKKQGKTPTELDQRLLKSLGIRPKPNLQNL